MNRSRFLGVLIVASLLLISPSAHARKKKPPPNWTSTTGVVASGSPQSHGTPAARSDSSAAAVNAITNLGCPSSDLPSDTETVVAQGEATAPAGTTAPIWELTTNGNLVLQNNNAFVLVAHITSYIGIAASGCVDFASCAPTLTPLVVADVEVGGGGSNQTVIPFIQDTGPTVALANTAVFFLTVTTQHPVSLGGSLTCASGSFIPVAHNQVL